MKGLFFFIKLFTVQYYIRILFSLQPATKYYRFKVVLAAKINYNDIRNEIRKKEEPA